MGRHRRAGTGTRCQPLSAVVGRRHIADNAAINNRTVARLTCGQHQGLHCCQASQEGSACLASGASGAAAAAAVAAATLQPSAMGAAM